MAELNLVLTELHDNDIQRLVAAGEVRSLMAGEDVIREGMESPPLFILLSGKLEVLAGNPPKQLAILFPGELVGEMSFVDKRSSSAVVRASAASQVLAIPRQAVEQILADDPAMAARFFRGIARLVVRRLRATVRHLGYGEAPVARPEIQLDRRLLERIAARAQVKV